VDEDAGIKVAGKLVDEDADNTGDSWLTDLGEEQLLAGFLLPGPGSGSSFRGQPQRGCFSWLPRWMPSEL
jgi:hypothetical protein